MVVQELKLNHSLQEQVTGTSATAPLGLCLAVGTWGWLCLSPPGSPVDFLSTPSLLQAALGVVSLPKKHGAVCGPQAAFAGRGSSAQAFPFPTSAFPLSGRTGLCGLPCTGLAQKLVMSKQKMITKPSSSQLLELALLRP